MDLNHLRHFLAVVDHGSFASAATDLGVTQSAVSQTIARLEREAGTRLLDRGRFGAVATSAGRALAERARLIVSEMRVAEGELEAYRSAARGHVTIGAGKSVSPTLIPDALARFLRSRPAAVVSAYEEWSPEMFRRLMLGELDFVVSAPLAGVEADRSLVQEELFLQTEYVLIGARHPVLRKRRVTADDLTSCCWVIPPHDVYRVREIHEAFKALGAAVPNRFLHTDSLLLLGAMIRRGEAIGLGSPMLHGLDFADQFRVVDLPGLTATRPAILTRRRRGALSPVAEALADEIRRLASDYAERELAAAARAVTIAIRNS